MTSRNNVVLVESVPQPIHKEFPLTLEIPMFLGILFGLGISAILQINVTAEIKRTKKEVLPLMKPENSSSPQNLVEAAEEKLTPNSQSPTPNPQIEFYNWENIVKEALGIIVAGNSGSAKTCLATWLLGKLTQDNPTQVLVLDPHANRNRLWGELGLTVINDFDLIENQLVKLEELLDERRNQPENGDTVITVAEELRACALNFSDSNRVQRTLERLGSEGRKYGLVLISVNTSPNSLDIGISAQNRNNFVTILCGASARHSVENRWKKDDERQRWILDQAYPAVVTGAVPCTVAVHPTHGHHAEFAITGKEPKGILPVNQKPLTIPLATEIEQPQLSHGAQKLLDWFKRKTVEPGMKFSLRKVQQSRPLGKNETHKLQFVEPLINELVEAELLDKDDKGNYFLIENQHC